MLIALQLNSVQGRSQEFRKGGGGGGQRNEQICGHAHCK